MSRPSLACALAFVSFVGIPSACTISPTNPLAGLDAGDPWPGLDDGGSRTEGGSSASVDAGNAGTDAAPSCQPCGDLWISECKAGGYAAVSGCLVGGTCTHDVQSACGDPGTGNTWEEKACSSQIECTTSAPVVHCACQSGDGFDAYKACVANVCSASAQDVCPDACNQSGGWAGCSAAIDCAPVICECADGHRPVPWASECAGGSCQPASALCPAACAQHGGWHGTPSVDAGGADAARALGQPGDPCTKGSDCVAFDCTCNDASVFKGNHVCESQTCATQADACGLVCTSSGGWSGH